MRFYTYFYFDSKLFEPIYVGKGTGERAFFHLTSKCTNKQLSGRLKKLKDDNLDPEIFILNAQNELTAHAFETFWIKVFGRKDLKLGTLFNHTDGGEGVSGLVHTEESRKKMSIAKKGKIAHNKGKSMSAEQRAKVSSSLTGKKASTETKAKMSATRIGKKMPPKSLETLKRMSAAQVGKKHSAETIAKRVATRQRNKML